MKIDKKDILHIAIIISGIIFLAIPIFHVNLWFDESYSVAICNHTFSEIWQIGMNDVHPILYYYVLHLINIILGHNIMLYRIFSWICACIIGVLGFTHIRKDFGKNIGILFSFFSLFLPITIMYVGEIRMYTFAMLLVTLMCIYAYRIYKNKGNKQIKNWIIFAIFSLASAYTHYYSLMAAGIVNLMLFIYFLIISIKEKHITYEIKAFIISSITQIILYIPWLMNILSKMGQQTGSFWISVSFPKTVIEFFTFQFVGQIEYKGRIIEILFGIIICTYLIYLYIKNRKDKKGTLPIKLSIVIYIGVIIGAGIVSIIIKTPIIYARYMLCVTGLFIFVLAYFMGQKGNKYVTTIICILCIIMAFTAEIKLCIENYDKNNKEPFTYLKANIKENDVLICANELSGFVVFTNFPNNNLYFYDENSWNVEEAYKAFGNDMKTIYNLDELKDIKGRIWVLGSSNYNLLEKIQEMYDVELIEKKLYSTKYYEFQYSFALIEK